MLAARAGRLTPGVPGQSVGTSAFAAELTSIVALTPTPKARPERNNPP